MNLLGRFAFNPIEAAVNVSHVFVGKKQMSTKREAPAISIPLVDPDRDQKWGAIGSDLFIYRGEHVWEVGYATYTLYKFSPDDELTKKLCMAQLSIQKLATESEIAQAFQCSCPTVSRAKAEFRRNGCQGLLPKTRGPKGPRMPAGLEDKIVKVYLSGKGYRIVSEELGVPVSTVRNVCKRHGIVRPSAKQDLLPLDPDPTDSTTNTDPQHGTPTPGQQAPVDTSDDSSQTHIDPKPYTSHELAPQPNLPAITVGPGEPAPARNTERALAYAGLLPKAEVDPEFVSGTEVPAAGILLALAMVGKDGSLEVARKVYGNLSNGFYGMRGLMLTLLSSTWLGFKTIDSLQHGRPHLWGRVVGLDRLPETKTISRKLKQIEGRKLGRQFMSKMAEHRIKADREVCGRLYVDGHVREYHGCRRVGKTFVTRRRTAMPAIEDYWVHDGSCAPLLKIAGGAGKSLCKVIRQIVDDAREWIGKDRALTVIFDRGGWSPKLFAELAAEGVWVVTYHKGKKRKYSTRQFDQEVPIHDSSGRNPKVYQVRDRRTRIGGRLFRSVSVLGKRSHQTEVITTDLKSKAVDILSEIFNRWGQENYFKYSRKHRGQDKLGCYEFEPVAEDVEIPNPAHKELDAQVKGAARRVKKVEKELGKGDKSKASWWQLKWWRGRMEKLKRKRRRTPRRILVGQLPEEERPEQPVHERKLFTDVIDMSASRIEAILLGLLSKHYKSSYKDGRELLRQIFRNTGDLEVQDDMLIVTLNALASPHQTKALCGLCENVNELNLKFPETNMTLCFRVHEHPSGC